MGQVTKNHSLNRQSENNLTMNENKVQSDKNLINSDQFIQDGFLKIPIKDLSTNLLINMIELLIRHIGSCKEVSVDDNFTGESTPMLIVTSSEEKKAVYNNGKIPKNSHMKNKERICGFCRTKHIFGYMNCPICTAAGVHTAKE